MSKTDKQWAVFCLFLILALSFSKCSAGAVHTQEYGWTEVLVPIIAALIFTFTLWFIGGLLLVIKQAWERELNRNQWNS